MSKSYSISSGASPLQTVLRTLFMIAAAIGGFFIFASAAAFAMFVILGLVIIGVVVFCVFWLRAKITGKPLMPNMKMYSFQAFNEQGGMKEKPARDKPSRSVDTSGPILDAHETPEGWSVDSD